MAIPPVGSAAVAAIEDDPANDFILKSQPKPEPRIILPTDALPKLDGPKKRIAAVTTAYFRYSHADDIITKFIEGYAIAERTHLPHCEVVSLAIEQFPRSDIGRGLAARYRIPLFGTPTGAVTLGGPKLGVDGMLLIGEHGDYPINARGSNSTPVAGCSPRSSRPSGARGAACRSTATSTSPTPGPTPSGCTANRASWGSP
jgi:hypothetical protein